MAASGAAEIVNFEAETLFFGFSPVMFVDCVINAVNDYVLDGADGLYQALKEQPGFNPAIAREGVNTVLRTIQDQLDEQFDKFELYCLQELFRIPAHIPLEGDLPPTADSVSAGADAELEAELIALRRQVQEAQYYNARLKARIQFTEALKQQLAAGESGGVGGGVVDIKAICKACNVVIPEQNITFLNTQIESLVEVGQQIAEQRASLARRPEAAADGRSLKRPRIEGSAADLQKLAQRL